MYRKCLFLKFAKQEIAHVHKIGCYSMARNYGTAIRSFKKGYSVNVSKK